MNDLALSKLLYLVSKHHEGFTHFTVDTSVEQSTVSGRTRVARQSIKSGSMIAVIGGLVVDQRDEMLAMPIGNGLYLHQISDDHKGTVNHSCDPNCRIDGFNKLVARRDISAGEELTIDYGTVSIGNGSTIIDSCRCGSENCRHTIRSDDYLNIDVKDLSIFAREARTIRKELE